VKRVGVGLRLALLPALVVVALVMAWRLGYFRLAGQEHLLTVIGQARHRAWAEPLYLIAFTIIATLGLPITVLTLVGGALFGVARGTALAWIGAMAATVAAYFLGRTIAQGSVRRFLGRHHLLTSLRKRSDFWALLRVRALPVAPFAVLDYLAGVAGASLRDLLLATAIGSIPTLVAYAYVGAQLAVGIEQAGEARVRAFWIAGAVTVVMLLISFLPRALRRFRE
jgi:uncharacterized membrane protein YdjX (TVP38/TMEM64 family)